MQSDNKILSLSKTIPPAPKTQRGNFTSLDISNDYFGYFNGPTLIVRPLSNQKQVLYFVHQSNVLAAKFSNDGKLIASIDQKGTLMIHQLAPKELFEFRKFENFYPNARALDWTADRKRVCVVGTGKSNFGRVALIDSGTNAGQISGVSAGLSCCSFRPQRPYHLVLGGDEYMLKFFQGPPYKFNKSSIKNHSNFINAVKYSPKGTYFISVSSDKKIVLYNGQNFEQIKQKIDCHQRSIFGADWIDQKRFFTVSADKTIKIWNTDLEQLSQIKCCNQQQFKDAKNIDSFQVGCKFYKDKIYSLGLDGQITGYNLPTQNDPKTIQYNKQKVTKYSGWLLKPSRLLQVQQKNNLLVLDNQGKILSFQTQNKLNLSNVVKNQNVYYGPSKFITSGFYNPLNKSLYILWTEGYISQFQVFQSHVTKQKVSVKDSQFKFVCSSDLSQYDFISVDSYLNGYKNCKLVQKSKLLEQDVTFVKSFQNFVVVGTIKGNLQIYDAKTLQFICKSKMGGSKLSCIYVQKSKSQGQFILISGDALGKFRISRFNSNKNQIEQASSNLGNHQSLITAIIPYNSDYLFTFGMDNKINLWYRNQQGNYNRKQDWTRMHQFGILSAQIYSKTLYTIGGDYLMKQWTINI